MTTAVNNSPAAGPRLDPASFEAEARRRRRVARERARTKLLLVIYLGSDPSGLGLKTTLRDLMSLARMRPSVMCKTLRRLARIGDVLVLKREWPDPARLILLTDHPAAVETARLAFGAGWQLDRMSEAAGSTVNG